MRGKTLAGLEAHHFKGLEAQPSLGHDRGIEAFQAARGCVARIGEEGLARFEQALIHRLKGGGRHHDLAAHFEQRGQLSAHELERHTGDRAQIVREIFAFGAIATREPLDQLAVTIDQCGRNAVPLRLGHVSRHRIAKTLAHPLVEIDDLVTREQRFDRDHGHHVRHAIELGALGQRRAHALGWRGRGDPFRVSLFELLNLAEKPVVSRIGHDRPRQHVVGVLGFAERAHELLVARAVSCHRG